MEQENNLRQSGKMYKIADLSSAANLNLSRSQQVDLVVSYILENAKSFSPEKALLTPDILKKYNALRQGHPNVFEIPSGSLSTYMSVLSNDSDSKISCSGKKQGYYLNFGSSYNSQTGKKDTKKIKEEVLYPILEEWLSVQCDQVKNIANERKGKQWCNPDILGINYSVFFQNNMIELTTIEAKRDLDDWRMNFFEAVAHSMFANRAYYAYLCKESEKIDKDLFLYAQKFGIGLIAIEVPDELWTSEMAIKLEYVKEKVPAPVHNVTIRIQKEFLNNFDIREVTDIHKFGKTNKDFGRE